MTYGYNGVRITEYHLGVSPDNEDRVVALSELDNFGMSVIGGSGSGKTYTIGKLIGQLYHSGVTAIVMDTQGDLGSESPYIDAPGSAFNEMDLDYAPDGDVHLNLFAIHHSGKGSGYYQTLKNAIKAIKMFHPSLGVMQQSYLSDLIEATYTRFGILMNDKCTWSMPAPCIDDVLETLDIFVKSKDVGVPEDIFLECSAIRSQAMALSKKSDQLDASLQADEEDDSKFQIADSVRKKLETTVESLKVAAGKAIDDAIFGDNAKVSGSLAVDTNTARGVRIVLEDMARTGLFSGSRPIEFVPGKINHINMKGIVDKDQAVMGFLIMDKIFREAFANCQELNSGILRYMAVCDEAKIIYSGAEDGMSPQRRISTEGRKAGLGALIGAQSTAQVPEDVLTNTALTILLRLDRKEWKPAKARFGLSDNDMSRIQGRRDGVIFKNGGQGEYTHMWTLIAPMEADAS